MANFDQLKQSVAALIRTNGAEEITGQIMQDVLLTIINSISGGYMFGGVAQHNGNVGNPDYNVFYLAGSGAYTGYGDAINIPNGCYGVFRYNGSWTQDVVDIGVHLTGTIREGETNGVTGDVINTALQTLFNNVMNILDTLTFTYNTPSAQQATKAMLDVIVTPTGGASHVLTTLTLVSATAAAAGLLSAADKAKLDALWSSGYQFAGIATPSTTPISTTSKIFYIATEAGTYFNAVTVTQGINILSWNGSAWSAVQVVGIDDEPTAGSDRLVKSGGVANELFKITGVKSHTQTIIKKNADWTYHIFAFSGLQGHKAKVTLKDPNGALTGATFYYGASTTGSYFYLNSGESKVITFPADFTELSMWVGDSWVITQNPANVEIIFEYAEGFEYRLEECEKTKPQVDENTLNLTNELEIKDKILGDSNQGYIESSGVITFYATRYYSTMLLKAGETIEVTTDINYPTIGIANSGNIAVGDTVEIVSGNKYTASEDTWIVISCGSNPSSIKLSGTLKIIADEKPTIGNDNFVRSNGVAESEKEIKIAGRIPQSTDVLVKYSTAFSVGYICNVGAKAGDTIIATLTDSKGIFESTTELILYHGNAQAGVPYTTMSVNSPTEIKINNDVEHFTLYVPKNTALRNGYVSLSIDYKNIFVAKLDELTDDVDALKTKCEMPFDNIISLNGNVSTTYDSGITIEDGQEIEVTLIDDGGIVTEEALPLYRNSISGSYVNLVPGVPTKITASEQTHFLLYVASAWISASGNVTLHVEYVNTSDIIDVVLPSKVYAYVGGEFNIYNENVAFITQKDRYYIFWSIENLNDYKVYSDRLRILPTSDMIGTHEVTLQVLDRFDNSVVYSKSFTLEIVANTPVTNKKVLFIGDSLTNAGYYPHFVEYLSNNGIQSIGTRESQVWSSFVEGRRDIVHHEGRGGWSAMDYVRNYADYKTDYPNPFWNEATEKFDFSYYITSQGYSRPDVVFINLGTNLVYFLDGNINAIKEMITSIHAYDNSIPVFVHLITPPATQNGWAYEGHGNSYVFDTQARDERKRYIKEFENKLANVDITPVYFNIDRYQDFATVEEQASQRNPTIVIRQANTVHPSRYGYYKMADVYYADLMNILS